MFNEFFFLCLTNSRIVLKNCQHFWPICNNIVFDILQLWSNNLGTNMNSKSTKFTKSLNFQCVNKSRDVNIFFSNQTLYHYWICVFKIHSPLQIFNVRVSNICRNASSNRTSSSENENLSNYDTKPSPLYQVNVATLFKARKYIFSNSEFSAKEQQFNAK